jgi:kumamolisin
MVERPVELPHSYRPPAAGARRIGNARPDDEVEVTITLRGPQLPAASDVTGPAMDRDTFAARYGADPDDGAKVKDELERLGLHVYDVSLVTRSMRVSGTVRQLNAAFSVTLGTYESDDQGQFRGREGYVSVPAPLAGIVTGVFGLDDRRMAQRENAPVQAAAAALAPADLEALYQFPPGEAAGQAIAIAEFGGAYSASDLEAFCQKYDRPVPVITLPALGQRADQQQPSGDSGEVMMDIEIIAALCPAASISVYFARFNEKGWIDLLDAVVKTEPLPPVAVANSWGRAEDSQDWSSSAVTEINQRLQTVAMLGVTVCAASGDDGAGDQMNDGRAHVNFPATSPFVLSVGGTMLTGTPPAEVVWWAAPGDRSQDGGGSSGGGVSTLFPRPAWQTVDVESLNAGSIDGRVVPDVAALAGQPYYDLFIGGQDSPGGGTSAAAPLWAALLARICAGLPDPSQRRFLTPLLYAAAPGGAAPGATVCTDITSGDNHSPGQPVGYEAGAGYDAVSGWGTPLGTTIAQFLSQPEGG